MNNTQLQPPYEVEQTLSSKEFASKLANFFRIHDKEFAQRDPEETQIFGYLNRYLKTETNSLKASTIVCEHSYTCLNYLEDYANYYSRTYTNYKKKCKRLHFFSEKFDKAKFEKMILNSSDDLWKSYLGCIVVKPIPRGGIGVTYLKTYAHSKTDSSIAHGKYAERYYKCLTTHSINLFGKELSVTTMPFKEQDGAVASCATTALWMAFQKTSELFGSTAPSLSEITILAGGEEEGTGRIFPSKGLSTFQLLTAISKLRMTPVIEEFFDHVSYFKGALHAYLKGDIPVLLGMEGIEGERNTFNHLVSANGYRYKTDKYNIASHKSQLLSDKIEVFYVNDDQIGPFSRAIIRSNNKTGKIEIETSWKKRNKGEFSDENIVASPGFIVVPLSSSIRVSFREIYISYIAISRLFDFLSKDFESPIKTNYDIYIIRSNEYKENRLSEKESIFDNWSKTTSKEKEDKLKSIVTASLPKYIWVIEARDDSGKLLFDYIYDTVEVKYDNTAIMINIFHDDVNHIIISYDSSIRFSFEIEYECFKKSLLRTLIVATKANTKRKALPPPEEEKEEQLKEEKTDSNLPQDTSAVVVDGESKAVDKTDEMHFKDDFTDRVPSREEQKKKRPLPPREPTQSIDE